MKPPPSPTPTLADRLLYESRIDPSPITLAEALRRARARLRKTRRLLP